MSALLLSIAFSSCDEEIVNPQVQDEILGLWELHGQSGSASELCENELAEFLSDGTAYFQCPGYDVQSTDYTAIDNVITFTQTGVQYSFAMPNDTNLVMTGMNVDRTLTYSRNITQ